LGQLENQINWTMRRLILAILFNLVAVISFCQVSGHQINSLIASLNANGNSESNVIKIINGIIKNPDLYNSVWKRFIDQAYNMDSTKWKFVKGLNLKLKTFQNADSSSSSLGLTYEVDFNYEKFVRRKETRIMHSFGLSTTGNIAFNSKINPNDFLETKVNYSFAHFIGGTLKTDNSTYYSKLNELENSLSRIKDMQSNEAMSLWEQFGKSFVFSNQFYYNISPKLGFESNQDFSKTQITPGMNLGLGLKAWDLSRTNILHIFNIVDYPFALVRLITGTDKCFTPYGSTIPTVQVGINYVVPTNDTTRKRIVGNLNPYPRFNIETSFRSLVSRINKEFIYFNADLRFYNEINAPHSIKAANLNKFMYFVMNLESTTGFYISYSTGKLPFDQKSSQVYSIGFTYKL
jgi:hypothetical protein